jgi:maltooligosyltrehalose synthase
MKSMAWTQATHKETARKKIEVTIMDDLSLIQEKMHGEIHRLTQRVEHLEQEALCSQNKTIRLCAAIRRGLLLIASAFDAKRA